jgi:hypothetical protein
LLNCLFGCRWHYVHLLGYFLAWEGMEAEYAALQQEQAALERPGLIALPQDIRAPCSCAFIMCSGVKSLLAEQARAAPAMEYEAEDSGRLVPQL